MGKKKIFNFTVNGIPIISRDDNGKWSVFKKADDHYNDIFNPEKFIETAETVNKTILKEKEEKEEKK